MSTEPDPNSARFLKACRREEVDRAPIWLMRQAGRYMAEYRALRAEHTILDLIHSPELSCEVTMQPIRAFGLDAAIIFADILPLLAEMGLDLEFVKGRGPVIHNPVQSAADAAALRQLEPGSLPYTLDAIRLSRKALAPSNTPLIGFSGAPWTLACYAIEGHGSKDFLGPRRFMHAEPAAFDALIEHLGAAVQQYLIDQIAAGAQAVQIFDSWGGILSPLDYAQRIAPVLRSIIAGIRSSAPDIPIIYFATGAASLFPTIRNLGADVLGLDWRVELDEGWDALGGPEAVAIQGNLDPALLLAPREQLLAGADRVLHQADGRWGHIFNIGHGINKETDPDNVKALVDHVQAAG